MNNEQDESFRWAIIAVGFACTVMFSPIYAIVICGLAYIAWYGGVIDAMADYYETHHSQPATAQTKIKRQPAARERLIEQEAIDELPETPAQPHLATGVAWKSEIETEPPPLLKTIEREPMIVIVGEKGSGKSTVARHIADQYKTVIVLDPHAERDTTTKADINWPSHFRVIGYGRNYAAINDAIMGIRNEMHQRYQAIGKGEISKEHLPRILVVTDEAIAINSNCPDFAKMQKELVTEARKVQISLMVATHSDNVEALGLKGLGNLRDGYAVVKLKRDRDGQRAATVKIGSSDPFPVSLPGPYQMRPQFPSRSQAVPSSSQERPEPAGTGAELPGTGAEPPTLAHPADWLRHVVNAPMFDALPSEMEALGISLDDLNKIAKLVNDGASLTAMQNEVRKRRETVKTVADYIRDTTA